MVTMKYDRYRLTGVIFILSCCFFPLRAGTFQTVFADGAAGWTVSGESSALVRKNGGTRFDSAAAVSEAYRYLTLTSPEIMDGDFPSHSPSASHVSTIGTVCGFRSVRFEEAIGVPRFIVQTRSRDRSCSAA